jgi:hypothetical protein
LLVLAGTDADVSQRRIEAVIEALLYGVIAPVTAEA